MAAVTLAALFLACRVRARRRRSRTDTLAIDVRTALDRRAHSLVTVELRPAAPSRLAQDAPRSHRNGEYFVEAVWSDVARRWAAAWSSDSRAPGDRTG